MTANSPHEMPGPDASAPARGAGWWRWIIIMMILAWAAALLSRNVIRAYWWADRLRAADSENARWMYVRRLQSLGDRAVPPMAGLLQDDSVELRSMAVTVLHYARSQRALELLLRACGDPAEDVRRAAIGGLVARGDERAVAQLAAIAATHDERTAMISTAGLRAVATDPAKRALVDLLRFSPHPGVRVEAIQALAALQVLGAVEPLIEALSDSTVFEGMTEGDIHAMRTFESVKDTIVRDFSLPADAVLNLPDRRVVGKTAARALSAITGHSFDGSAALASDMTRLQQAWRSWWKDAAPETVKEP